jgi:hypothetical protein
VGEGKDPETKISLCSTDSVITSFTSKKRIRRALHVENFRVVSWQYYLIFGSYRVFNKPRSSDKFDKCGFVNASILEKMENLERLSICMKLWKQLER